jgi:protein disulfide-isomerase
LAGLVSVCLVLSGCVNSSLKSLFKNESLATPESVSLTIWGEDFEAAIEESKSTGKPILADFTGSDWCHWCVKLKQDVFETEVFRQWADENVILLELDYPKRNRQSQEIKQQNAALAERYNVQGYPTVLILNGSGEVLGKLGYLEDPGEWISQAQQYLARPVGTNEFAR